MPEIIPEGVRIRVLMGQLKTTNDSFCERGMLSNAQSLYERMKALEGKYPDQPDLLAALVDSSFILFNAYEKDKMAEMAKQIRADLERLNVRLSKNTELRKQVLDFYEKVTGQ
jgi:hypothetical protein